ncbi:uncharacterized protein JN550_000504 [Neoarthrinium moseri]|uniref:uncharacterized protein n=1 Tax=Neoarthrinium moseri TaxID=1658444 RepID=UPI001FDADA78|nr:uncharacterized protein JN550_000504 [Neoarthrinium moseri]KAI1878322.1 hypothetical protein JN550_000504 [Neoarthrinium moseri]
MSEDVSKFLEQVKELGDRRLDEDEARSRELEEKILQDRKERQARRAERARSISPQKSSPANTPPPSTHRATTPGASQRLQLDSSPILDPPTSPKSSADAPQAEAMGSRDFYASSASKENESPFDADSKRASNATSPTRSATVRGLNWQRRPNSQASNGSRSRPLSMVAAENAARSSTTPSEPSSVTEAIPRDQIANALSSKDPSWFRQTADRGASSGAYRKNQVEDEERMDMSSMRAQLPGLARRPSEEPTKDESSAPLESPGAHRTLGSPLSLSSLQRLDPPQNDGQLELDSTSEQQPMMSPPPLGRSSPTRTDRPASPTKGMGGFVQSAMMKRSDSVSKRWSVQSPKGLQRADSVASNRNSFNPSRSVVGSSVRPTSLGRETSTESTSRPGSSLGNQQEQAEESISRKISDSLRVDTQPTREPEAQDSDDAALPTSPSKTMDPKRWSPTKASWLESALNKPDSPKPKPTPPPANQPAWMAEIARAKAQKAANPIGELSRTPTGSHKHQVSIGGLMRSAAPGVGTKAVPFGGASGPSTPTVTTHHTGHKGARNDSVDSTKPGEGTRAVESATNSSSKGVDDVTSKAKPETPPKKDFRASLKARPPPSSSGSSNNPEFKNVFGNLRKTTTQNYVAPDELKDNITRGKAALNFTGGPKKTERKDEFKEAILAKKKEFQQSQTEGRGITRNSSTASEQPVPEGLIKSLEMRRSNTIRRDTASSDAAPTLEQLKRRSTVSRTGPATPVAERMSIHEKRDSKSSIPPFEERRPSLASNRDPVKSPAEPKPADALPGLQKETSAPGRLQGKVGGSALANRFNPALAGLLARGPPPMASGPSEAQASSPSSGGGNDEPGQGPKLTHMTKGRARGPKRKAPTSTTAAGSANSPAETPPAIEPKAEVKPAQTETTDINRDLKEPSIPAAAPEPQVISLVDSSKKVYDYSPRPKPQTISLVDSDKSAADPARGQTANPPRPGRSHVRTKSRVFEQVAAFAAQRNSPSPTKQQESSLTGSQPPSPRKLDLNRVSKFGADSSPEKSPERQRPQETRTVEADPTPRALFSKPAVSTVSKPESGSPQPHISGRPLPEPHLSQSNVPPPRESAEPMASAGDGLAALSSRALPPKPSSARSTPVKPRPLPEPLSSSRPLPSPGPLSPPSLASPMRSPTKQAMEASSVLVEFFGSERPQRNYHVDAAELLMQRPSVSAPKIQTLSAQLFQFSADGKKVPVPAHHERVLFEREMYLCSHTFNNEAGKKTSEVYFWAGDEVPSSEVEDASIFATREAKALGGKLVKLQQSKETPEFMAALGGIVITRRGSSNKYDSLAPHMLCGRRYLGQIVFDEVDLTPLALCSGFPFLITSSGKCYLWKGKGSGVDELSCARLIGMDYALSGELDEVEDGREPSDFWGLFGGGSKVGSADHWRLKPNYDKYCSRLFCSDAESKQQIVELSPFSQRDLQPSSIYVLDAFFELYIIVGARAQPQYASFHNALEFAQEYAILASSMEDRPFIPVSTVILEGIPRDMKSVFRKWRDADSPTIMNAPGAGTGLRRGRSLRIVPLNTALQALRD